REVKVVNLFAGQPQVDLLAEFDRMSGAVSPMRRMEERRAEDREALSMIGREAVNLPYLDGQYRSGVDPDFNEALELIHLEIPAISECYVPAAISEHRDHWIARQLGVELSQQGVPVKLYADIPHCVKWGWPHWVTGERKDPYLDVDFFWQMRLAGVFG